MHKVAAFSGIVKKTVSKALKIAYFEMHTISTLRV